MKKALAYIKPYKKQYLFLFFILIVSAVLTALGPYFYKLLIDNGILAKRFDVLLGLMGIMLVIEVGTMIFGWLETYFFTKVGQNIIKDVKSDAYRSLTLKSSKFYSTNTVGDLISRIDGDAEYLESALTRNLVNLVSDIVTVIAMASFLIYLNYHLFLLAAVVLPFAFLAQKIIGRKIDTLFTKLRNLFGDTSRFLFETVSHMSSFKSHGREKYLQDSYNKKISQLAQTNIEVGKTFAYSAGSIHLLNSIATGVITIAGGYLVIKGNLTLGGLVSFTSYFFKVFGPVQNFARINLDLVTAKVSWERISEIITDDQSPDSGKLKPNFSLNDIAFKNVFFGYGDDKLVLKNLSWSLPANKTMLLQGASGVGKTTSINLILRHFKIKKGSIVIGGIDISKIDPSWLRSNVFVVEQDPLIISGTLKENLSIFTDNKISPSKIKESLYQACLDDLVNSWPNGIDTEIGENGINLSGGQKQRIAIARAILANPPILMMDEATSAIDLDTELEILKRMKSFLDKRTVIIVTHRPAELVKADVVLKLEPIKKPQDLLTQGLIMESAN